MKIKLIAFMLLATAACAQNPATTPVDNRNSSLTQGNVQMSVAVGQTTKAEILETFGAPNVTTRDGSGKETWSYQRAATASQSASSESAWSVIFYGESREASGFSQTSRMMTLIIKFDESDVVSDFKSRESNF
jgi:outer membrane protein assembly factor BamE (lipoprotein component of BamABCDE complex)